MPMGSYQMPATTAFPGAPTTVQAPAQYVQAMQPRQQQLVVPGQYGQPMGTMMGGAPVGTFTQYGGQVGVPQGTVMMAGAPGTQVMMPGTMAGGAPFVGGMPMSGGQLKAG